jgi:hypothetical protein
MMKTLITNGLFKNIFNLKIQKSMFSKIVPLKLSDLGEGTKEATIKKWFKKEGDIINEVFSIFLFRKKIL